MDALLALVAILGPVAIGSALIVAGAVRGWAPWPWLVGLGVALIPACWMAAVELCGQIAGRCITGDELSASRLALVSVVLFATAATLLAARRDLVARALALLGQAWLLIKLIDSQEGPAAITVGLLMLVEFGYEAGTRRRGAPAA